MIGLLDENGTASRQWKDTKKEIRDHHQSKDAVGCSNPILMDKHFAKIIKDAEGGRCLKTDHALTFINTERERGDVCVYDGKK